jgi:DNA polymerase (family 10)
MKAFHSHPLVKEKVVGGKAKARAILTNGMRADLCLVADDEFISALHYFTGSKEHSITFYIFLIFFFFLMHKILVCDR